MTGHPVRQSVILDDDPTISCQQLVTAVTLFPIRQATLGNRRTVHRFGTGHNPSAAF